MKIVHREFITPSTKTCHASSIAFYKNLPVYAYFGGTNEGCEDSSIYVKYNGKTLSYGEKAPVAMWNPVLYSFDDKLFLFLKAGRFCDSWQTFICDLSDIDKDNFEIKKLKHLPAGLNGPVKTKPILHDDKIYCGSSVETIVDWTSYIEAYNYKNGEFYFHSRSRPLVLPKIRYYDSTYVKYRQAMGLIQPSLWVDNNNDLHAFFRTSRGFDNIAYSKNIMGEWSDPTFVDILNPNSGIDTVYFNNSLFLVYNPSKKYRTPLVVAKLDDKFKIDEELVVADKNSMEKSQNEIMISRELSYPFMICENGMLHLTYTYCRRKIEYVQIEI